MSEKRLTAKVQDHAQLSETEITVINQQENQKLLRDVESATTSDSKISTTLNLLQGRATYEGLIQNNLPEGAGSLTWDGKVYEGEWKAGFLQAENKSEIYDFKSDEQHTNALIWSELSVYVGQVQNRQPHGKGQLGFKNGDRYEGHFKNGFFNGIGTYTLSNPFFLIDQSKTNVQYLKRQQDGKYTIEGLWSFGSFSTKSQTEQHLEKTLKREQIANNVAVPFEIENIQQHLRVKIDGQTAIAAVRRRNVNLFNACQKETLGDQIRAKFVQPYMNTNGCRQLSIQWTSGQQLCQVCKSSISQQHLAYASPDNRSGRVVICSKCIGERCHNVQIFEKTSESLFYKEMKIDGDLNMTEVEMHEQLKTSQSIYSIHFYTAPDISLGLKQHYCLQVPNPVIINRQNRPQNDWLKGDEFPQQHFEEEMLFMDTTNKFLNYFDYNKETKKLCLNRIDLTECKFDEQKQNLQLHQAELEMHDLLRDKLELSLGLRNDSNNQPAIIQWPKMTYKYMAVNGLNSMKDYSFDYNDEMNKTFKEKNYLSDTFVFDISTKDDYLIHYENIGLYLTALSTEGEEMKFYTLQASKTNSQECSLMYDQFEPVENGSAASVQDEIRTLNHNSKVKLKTTKIGFEDNDLSITNPSIFMYNLRLEGNTLRIDCESSQSENDQQVLMFSIMDTLNPNGLISFKYIEGQPTARCNDVIGASYSFGQFGHSQYMGPLYFGKQIDAKTTEFDLRVYKCNQSTSTAAFVRLPSEIKLRNKKGCFVRIARLDDEKSESSTMDLLVVYKTQQDQPSTSLVVKAFLSLDEIQGIPKWLENERLLTQYPVQARSQVGSNIVMFSNLACNSMQLKLNLFPIEFESFVQTDISRYGPNDLTSTNLVTHIYLIVLMKGKRSLICLDANPWQPTEQWSLKVIEMNYQSQENPRSIIQQATLFRSVQKDRYGDQYLLADHLIYSCNPVDNEEQQINYVCLDTSVDQFLSVKSSRMDGKFVVGPFNQVFYVNPDKKNQVMSISQSQAKDSLEPKLVYEHNCQIEIVQILEPDHMHWNDQDQKAHLAILDSEFNYYRLTHDSKIQLSAPFFTAEQQQFDNSALKKAPDALEQLILTEKTIEIPTLKEQGTQSKVIHMVTDLEAEVKTFNLNRKKGQAQCMHMELAPYSQRTVSKIVEGEIAYLQTSKLGSSNHLNLLGAHQQRNMHQFKRSEFGIEYFLMHSSIIVSSFQQVMVFDKATLMMQSQRKISCGPWHVRILKDYRQQRMVAFLWELATEYQVIVYKDSPEEPSNDFKLEGKNQFLIDRNYFGAYFQMQIMNKQSDLVLNQTGSVYQFTLNFHPFQQGSVILEDLTKIQLVKADSKMSPHIEKHISLMIPSVFINQDFQLIVLQTENYLVLNINSNKILYFKCRAHELNQEQTYEFDAKMVPLLKWIEEEAWEHGARIDYALGTNPRVAGKKDVIQISSNQHAILFDLSREQEVSNLMFYDKITSQRTIFANTGFTLYDLSSTGICQFSKGSIESKFGRHTQMTHDVQKERIEYDCGNSIVTRPAHMASQVAQCFKLYSEYDIREIMHFVDQEIKKDTKFDTKVLFSNICGLTTLQILLDQPGHIEKLTDLFLQASYETENDENLVEHDHPLVKFMYLNLVACCQTNHETNESTLNYAMNNHQESFTSLIKLAGLSLSANKSDIITKFSDIPLLFKMNDMFVNMFMAKRSIQTFMSMEISQIEWVGSRKQILFSDNSSLLSSKQILTRLKEEQEVSKFQRLVSAPDTKYLTVSCQVFNIEWLQKNVHKLYRYLSAESDPKLYNNTMINATLMKSDYTMHILPQAIIFVGQLVLVYIHHSSVMQSGHKSAQDIWITVLTLIFIILQVLHELFQIHMEGFKQYLIQPFNFLQYSTISINLYCVGYGYFTPYDQLMSMDTLSTTVNLPSIGITLLVISSVYWMNLFEQTSFYVTLILESFTDIKAFMGLLLIILAAFTAGTTVIDKNVHRIQSYHAQSDEEEPIQFIAERFGNTFVDSFFMQWLLGLGEFEMLGTADESDTSFNSVRYLLFVLFVLATLISQIVMFNTLIAILGDTYARITEKRTLYAVKARTEIYSDFMYQIRWIGFNDFTSKAFIYVVRPEDADEDAEWEGAISSIKGRIDKMKVLLYSQNSQIITKNSETHNKVISVEEQLREVKAQNIEMKAMLQQISSKV